MQHIVPADTLAGVDLWGLLNRQWEQARKYRRRWADRQVALSFDDDGDDQAEDEQVKAFHQQWMGKIGTALAAEYPGHGEMVLIESEFNGIIRISLPPILVSPDGVIVNLKDPDPVATAKKYFGELLERFKLERARFHPADVRAVVQGRSIVDVRRGVVPV